MTRQKRPIQTRCGFCERGEVIWCGTKMVCPLCGGSGIAGEKGTKDDNED